MARPTSKKKSEAGQALVELRRRMQMSQQQFATHAGLALGTVAKYEARPPARGQALEVFEKVASDAGHLDLCLIFARARQQTGDDLLAMLEHFVPSGDQLHRIRQREVHLARQFDELVPDVARRDELKQMFVDYANDWRDYLRKQVKYERDLRMNA